MTSHLNKIIVALFLCLQVFTHAQTLDKDGIPDVKLPYSLVNDFANILSDDNEQLLEQKLLAFNDSTTNQIYIITVTDIGNYSIEDYALRTARKWKIGQQDKNNGILVLISKNDRKVDIEVGYGLEAVVSDYDSRHIINDLIVPAFKQSNYALGINDAVDRLIGLIQGTYVTKATEEKNEQPPIWFYIIIIIIGGFVLYSIFFGKGGVGGGSTYSSSGSSWNSGSSWSGSSSGGFSGGGGGSFGGGGSSGSW